MTDHPDLPTPVPLGAPPLPSMSLRDWYAGQALCGLISVGHMREEPAPHCFEGPSEAAYKLADAMMKEREND